MKHFLVLHDLNTQQLRSVLGKAERFAATAGQTDNSLTGKVLVMIFQLSSTRTRISFEAGMAQLGGSAIYLNAADSQLARGEPIADTAKVISSMVSAVMIRNNDHAWQQQLAANSSVPVINGLSDLQHPCQILADILTFEQVHGPIAGATIAWVGDANNVCTAWIEAAKLLDFKLQIAAPTGYQPTAAALEFAGDAVSVTTDPYAAVEGASCVVTDVWASMGDEVQTAKRHADLKNYQVNRKLMAVAAEAIFMHCLPAHRGEEVEAAVIDGPASVVWQEAENRLHAQKGLLSYLLLGPADE